MVVKDEPFGIGLHSGGDEAGDGWDAADKVPTKQERTSFMQCLQLYNDRKSPTVFFTYCRPYEMQAIKEIMEDFGYKSGHPMYIYKVGQNAGGLKQFIFAVDTGFIAYRPSKDKVQWCGPQNPLQRHNMIFVPNMKDKRLKAQDGTIVNKTEKHPLVTRALCARFCKKGDYVLIAGTGAGGDVEGALAAGCNVVGIEKDAYQFSQTNDRVFKLFTSELNKIACVVPLFTDDQDDTETMFNMMGLRSHFGASPLEMEEDPDEDTAKKLEFDGDTGDSKSVQCGVCLTDFNSDDGRVCTLVHCETLLHLQKSCIKFTCETCLGPFCSANHKTIHSCAKAAKKAPKPADSAKPVVQSSSSSSHPPGSATHTE
jgi:hypothetical protein